MIHAVTPYAEWTGIGQFFFWIGIPLTALTLILLYRAWKQDFPELGPRQRAIILIPPVVVLCLVLTVFHAWWTVGTALTILAGFCWCVVGVFWFICNGIYKLWDWAEREDSQSKRKPECQEPGCLDSSFEHHVTTRCDDRCLNP